MAGLLDFLAGSNDPSTADPNTGLVDAQRKQLAYSLLGQTGAALLAAGAPQMPGSGQMGQHLAQLGNIPGNIAAQQSQMVQQNAMNQQTIARQRQNQQQKDLAAYIQTPEFQDQFNKLPPGQKAIVGAAAKTGDVNAMLKALQEAQVASQVKFTPDGSAYNPLTGDLYNPITGTHVNIQAQLSGQTQQPDGLPPGTPSTPGNLHGDDFLKTLSPSFAMTVKAIAEGRMPMPSGFIMKTSYGQALMNALGQYEPGFEGTDFNARNATAKAFASGKEAQAIRALNQATQHMAVLHQAGAALNNTDYPLLNYGLNMLAAAGGSAKPTNFIAAAHPVAEEVSKIFKGANLSDSEVRQWEKSLSPNMSPEQMQGALETINHLMEGAIDALNVQYKKTMNKDLNPLTPQSQQTLEYIKTHPLDAKTPPAAAASPTLPDGTPITDRAAAAPPVPGARQAPDGNWYVADPKRPGKYLMVK